MFTPFVFRGFEQTGGGSCPYPIVGAEEFIGFDTNTTSLYPVNTNQEYSYSATIYRSVDAGSAKQITGLEYRVDSGSRAFFDQTIIIAHIGENEFSETVGGTIDLSSYDIRDSLTAYTGTISMSSPVGTITFDENFCYNGTDNIIIIWENRSNFTSAFGPDFQITSHDAFLDAVIYAYDTSSFPTTIDGITSFAPNIRLQY